MLRSMGSVVVTPDMIVYFEGTRLLEREDNCVTGGSVAVDTKTTVTFNPKGLVATCVFLGVVGVALALAQDIEVAAGAGAAASLVAYLFVDVVFAVNPGYWRWRRD